MTLGRIYKIINNVNDDVYIGSTKQKLSSRMSSHRSHYKKWKKGIEGLCVSYLMFDSVGVENCKIILIEDYEYEDKEHLKKREQFHIDNNICINKIRAHRSPEYYQEYIQEYYQENKDKIKEQKKEYRQENKEEILKQKKEYYQENKDKIKEHKKEYYQKNREEINRRQRERYALKKAQKNIENV